MTPKIVYKPQDDVLMVWFSDGPIDHAAMVGSSIMHVGPANEPVLLEILDAGDFLKELNAVLETATEATPTLTPAR